MAFGIGFQELVIIAVLFLVIFGPSKLPQMARDVGRFVSEARRSIDEFKDELTAAEIEKEDKKNGKRSIRDRDEDKPDDSDEDGYDL
jgi:Tat protein translocase TatB subunit